MELEKFVGHKSRVRDYFEMMRNTVYTTLLYTSNSKLMNILTEYERHLSSVLPLIDSISIDSDIQSLNSISMGIGCTGMDVRQYATEEGIFDSSIEVISALSNLIEKEIDKIIEEKDK